MDRESQSNGGQKVPLPRKGLRGGQVPVCLRGYHAGCVRARRSARVRCLQVQGRWIEEGDRTRVRWLPPRLWHGGRHGADGRAARRRGSWTPQAARYRVSRSRCAADTLDCSQLSGRNARQCFGLQAEGAATRRGSAEGGMPPRRTVARRGSRMKARSAGFSGCGSSPSLPCSRSQPGSSRRYVLGDRRPRSRVDR